MQAAQRLEVHEAFCKVPVFPLPEESAARLPLSSLKSQRAINPNARLFAALMVRKIVVDAAVPEPVTPMTIGKTPVGLTGDVAKVSVVLHVAAHVATEKAAVTPTGNDDAENVTDTGGPDRRSAVIPSVADCPRARESAGAAANNESEVGIAAVTNVKSPENVVPPFEFVELTRK
jgi:hypothetical protein